MCQKIYPFPKHADYSKYNWKCFRRIGHHDKFPQFHIVGVIFYFVPKNICQYTGIGQNHFSIYNISKIINSILGAYRDKIGPIIKIISMLHTCRRDAIFIFKFTIFHNFTISFPIVAGFGIIVLVC